MGVPRGAIVPQGWYVANNNISSSVFDSDVSTHPSISIQPPARSPHSPYPPIHPRSLAIYVYPYVRICVDR